ncbi:MAG TPA: TetR/AcrR family transcriptional regulator [Acidimicrobiales bacterium]|jgi:AcrR family transcriptional regulator
MVDSLRVTRVSIVRDPVLTRDRILDAVSEQLECSGIAGLRLKDVADRLNVSVPSLYRFFEDREAMIAAAYVRDFSLQTFVDIDELKDVFAKAETVEDYEKGLRRVIVDIFGDQSRRDRWRKVAAIAATRHDPVLMEQIGSVQSEFTGRVAEMYAAARERGWVTSSINPLAFAFAVQGLAMGPLFADVAPVSGVTSEDFTEVFIAFHRAMTS